MTIRSLNIHGTATGGVVIGEGSTSITLATPIRLQTSSGASCAVGYDETRTENGVLLGQAQVDLGDGVSVRIEDQWIESENKSAAILKRRFTPLAGAHAVRYDLEALIGETADAQPWRYFLSGALYNRNDTDSDGKEDYLGTYWQEYRDDRNGHLGVLAFAPSSKHSYSLCRTSAPVSDEAISEEELQSGVVVTEGDIGSLGVNEGDSGSATLRAGFPFAEAHTFALDTTGRGWSGFVPANTGKSWTIEYEFVIQPAVDLTDAIWQITTAQRQNLGTRPTDLPLPMEEIEKHRFELVQQYFRSWNEEEDPRKPAGYLVHFSPRDGKTLGSLLEFGFTGAQSLLALASLTRGHREEVPLWADRARQVMNFLVEECIQPNGFTEGLYDTVNQEFVRWFTGILMPFQYATDQDELRSYLGSQLTDALSSVAGKLRDVPGNYTRTMCEAALTVLLAYEEERRYGVSQPTWLAAAQRVGDFLLQGQQENGSWFRGYGPDGQPLLEPVEWFGASALERASGTSFAVSTMAKLFEVTGREEYKSAALRGADFLLDTYVDDVLYCGGLNDTAHVKSVKVDSTGVMFTMRALMRAYRVSDQQKYLDAAVKAAKVASSWVFLWDVPFPAQTLLGDADFRTTGWVTCDAIPAGSYVEDVFLEFIPDLAEVGVTAGERDLVEMAQLVMHGMQQGVSLPGRMLGYAAPGIQCEGYMTSYWLSAPEETMFSGAVGKRKGDDNDTCNGFVNGAALYGLDTLRELFGTTDLVDIRARAQKQHDTQSSGE